MTTQDAIKWAGSAKKLADLLEIWPQTVYTWGKFPPRGKQFEIEVRSGGALKVERGIIGKS